MIIKYDHDQLLWSDLKLYLDNEVIRAPEILNATLRFWEPYSFRCLKFYPQIYYPPFLTLDWPSLSDQPFHYRLQEIKLRGEAKDRRLTWRDIKNFIETESKNISQIFDLNSPVYVKLITEVEKSGEIDIAILKPELYTEEEFGIIEDTKANKLEVKNQPIMVSKQEPLI